MINRSISKNESTNIQQYCFIYSSFSTVNRRNSVHDSKKLPFLVKTNSVEQVLFFSIVVRHKYTHCGGHHVSDTPQWI